MLVFRELTANDIEVRAARCGSNWAQLLLYKDARCDMNILDEAVGPMNWTRSHSRDNANCVVSIWDEQKKQWIYKEDTGTESNTEKEKGLASDSFKRACVNWGIGRSLYTAPAIFINVDCENRNGKYYLPPKYKLKVTEYETEEGRISYLVIKHEDEVVYEFGKSKNQMEIKPEEEEEEEEREIIEWHGPHPFAEECDDDVLPFNGWGEDWGPGKTNPVIQKVEEIKNGSNKDNEKSDKKTDENIARVSAAEFGTTPKGRQYIKITYSYKNRVEDKTQFQLVSTYYGLHAAIKTLKELQVMDGEQFENTNASDLSKIEDAIKWLCEHKGEREYRVIVEKNSAGYDEYTIEAV